MQGASLVPLTTGKPAAQPVKVWKDESVQANSTDELFCFKPSHAVEKVWCVERV